MTPSAAKAKGRRLQDLIVRAFRARWPALEDDDVKPAIMGESGLDVKLSPAARKLIPFDVEAKNVEKLNWWAAWAQTLANAHPSRVPLLVVKRNRSEVLATLRLDDLLDLISCASASPAPTRSASRASTAASSKTSAASTAARQPASSRRGSRGAAR